jgi:hypothetical protein
MDEIRKRKVYCHKNKLIPDHFGLLPIGVGKWQHLLKWFSKSLKWKRLQALFGLLAPHYGKCLDVPVKPTIY